MLVFSISVLAQSSIVFDLKLAIQINKATFQIGNRFYTLKDGKWSDKETEVELDQYKVGSKAIAVILTTNYGGSGVYVHLVVLDKNLHQLAYRPLGDRTIVEEIFIGDEIVFVAGLFHGYDDPMCCPTHQQLVSVKISEIKNQGTNSQGPLVK